MTLNDLVEAVQEVAEAYRGSNHRKECYILYLCDNLICKIKEIGKFR